MKLFSVLGLTGFLMLFANHASAILITIDPSSEKIHPGTNIFFDIKISGLHETLPTGNQVNSVLGAFSLDFHYNPQLLLFSSSMGGWGGYLGDARTGEAIGFLDAASTPGVISLGQVSLLEESAATCTFCIAPYLDDMQRDPSSGAYLDSFTLATLGLYAPYGGNPDAPSWPTGWTSSSAVFEVDNVVLSDASGNVIPLLDAGGNPIGTAPISTSNLILPVPEPDTIFLIGVGLLALLLMSTKRLGSVERLK